MKIQLPPKVKYLTDRLEKSGFSAFAVGGCIRNSLLGIPPKDWDICTSAAPEDIKRCFADLKTIDIGIRHGTVAVLLDGEKYEITTYRIEGVYSDNRRPDSVSFTDDVKLDLARRDFTVNAMAYNEKSGLVDPFGGREDLKSNLLRCVGDPDRRFKEDALRIMRALRFASVYGFEIEQKTSDAVHRNRELLLFIAVERIREELIGLLCGKNVERILNDYRDVLAVFIPELSECFDFDQRNKHHRFDVFRHIAHSVSVVKNDPLLRLTMLFHDIGKPRACTTDENGCCHFKRHQRISADMSITIMRRLRFSCTEIDDVIKLIDYHDVRFSGSKSQVKRLMRVLGADLTKDLFEIQRADILSQSDYLREQKLAAVSRAEEQFEEIIEDKEIYQLKALAVNGDDLISAGIADGRTIGCVLTMLLDNVIDGIAENNKNDLLKLAEKYIDSMNLKNPDL